METKEIARNLNHFVNEIRLGYKGTIDLSLLSEASERLKELESEKENLIHYNADLNNQLNEAEFHIEKLKKQLSEKPEWISVEDRLPEPLTSVLAYDYKNKRVGLFCFKNPENMVSFYSHWMPLPEPPKPKEPTFKDVFLKAFPKTIMNDSGTPRISFCTVFPYMRDGDVVCKKSMRCVECWNQPYFEPQEEGEADA